MNEHSFQAADSDAHQRLDVFLTRQFGEAHSRTFIKKLIDHGHVTIGDHAVKANHKVLPGETVCVVIPPEFLAPVTIAPEPIPLDILYEDKDILVLNKPSGLLVHPATGIYSGTLVNALLHHCGELSDYHEDILRPGIVHRLDQETSGVMVVAKNNQAHRNLAKQFQKHHVEKEYAALVEGEVAFDEGQIDVPIGRDPIHREKKKVSFEESAKEAFTRYKVLKRQPKCTLVALFPRTGRTHQLRVHMKYLKHPILGDEKYGKKDSFPRLALHARQITFTHPVTGEKMSFAAPVPAEFERVFK